MPSIVGAERNFRGNEGSSQRDPQSSLQPRNELAREISQGQFSPWVMERTEPLTAYGPRGRRVMTAHIEKGWQEDIRVRTQGPEKANRTGYRVLVHEITSGVVYRDPNVTVTAFAVAAVTFACTSHKGIADPLSLIVHSRLCLSSVRSRRLVNTGR